MICCKVEYKQDKLLTHPMVAALIHDKWKSVYGAFSFTQWFIYIAFLCCTTALNSFQPPKPKQYLLYYNGRYSKNFGIIYNHYDSMMLYMIIYR